MQLEFARGWDVGIRRKNNEDSYLVWQPDSSRELNGEAWTAPETLPAASGFDAPIGLFLVADGVGGSAAGEVASKLAVETVAREVVRTLQSNPGSSPAEPDWRGILQAAVAHANDEILRARQQAGNDMGTTLVGALVVGATAYVLNVGDSRAYLITRDRAQRITHDHSFVQYLVDSKQIAESDVRTHPKRNIILHSLGNEAHVTPDLFVVPLAPEQTLLLCSDGLWEMMQDNDLFRLVYPARDLDAAATALVALANKNGGADNISVLLIRASQ